MPNRLYISITIGNQSVNMLFTKKNYKNIKKLNNALWNLSVTIKPDEIIMKNSVIMRSR